MDAARVHPFPSIGDVFTDSRDAGRVLRVTRHDEAGIVVLSLWRDGRCAGTFRLPLDQAGRLVHVLVDALDAAATPTR